MMARQPVRTSGSNMDKILQHHKKIDSRLSGDWKPNKKERSTIRLMPPVGGADVFFLEVGRHFNVGPHGKMVICLKVNADSECPVCDRIEELRQSNNQTDHKLADKMKVDVRYYVYLVDIDEAPDNIQKGVMPQTVMKEIFFLCSLPDRGDVSHSETGRNIIIGCKGQKMSTKYTVSDEININPINTMSEEVEKELETIKPLSETIRVYTPNQVRDIMAGIAVEDDDDTGREVSVQRPQCFGDEAVFSTSDNQCLECESFTACRRRVVSSRSEQPSRQPSRQPARRPARGASARDDARRR